jgi:hypothetical protein
MINFILIAVVAILLTIGLVWLIDKFIPAKFKSILIIALWGLIAFLGYQTFMSIYNPILFQEVKVKRYEKVIDKLKDIRDSELAYRTINRKYTDNYDTLINFIETAKFPIIERRDSSVVDVERTRQYNGVEMRKEITIIDTLAFIPVKDSLFKGSDRYKKMMDVPFAKEGTKFELKTGLIGEEDEVKIPVFEATVKKEEILHDQNREYILQENQVISVEDVNGPTIKVGSLQEVSEKGNWPKLYDTKK